ncbi:conjugal transfer protein [Lactococcus lactis]|uniref:conjugal transfer protein n=1 Tax=Lactococcus lactis TaxID=1358 RepID=UPI0035CBC6C5
MFDFKKYRAISSAKLCNRTDYYMMEDVLPIISQNFIYSELVNPIIQKKEKQYLVKIAVRYLDNETKIENISQYQLTLEKKDNWKIIMNE